MKVLEKPNKWGCTIKMAKKEKCEACHRENVSYQYSSTSLDCPVDVSAYICPYKQDKNCHRSKNCNGTHALCRQCLSEYWEEWKNHEDEYWGFCAFISSQEQRVMLT